MQKQFFKYLRPICPKFLGMLVVLIAFLIPLATADERPLYEDISQDDNKIHIKANTLIANSNENMAEFKGHVRATRGNMVITCGRLKLFFIQGGMAVNSTSPSNNSIERILAKQNVKIKMDDRMAFADEAEYLMASGDITLVGEPVKVTSGNTFIRGHKITMTSDGLITGISQKGEQMEVILYPEDKKSEQ